jgi:hypothetical protein
MFTTRREDDGKELQIPNNLFFQKMFRVGDQPAAPTTGSRQHGEVAPLAPENHGQRHCANGITQTHTTVLETKTWEIHVEQSLAREILLDGSRMPALNLRPMFESLADDLDQRVKSLIEESVAQAIRTAILKPDA